MLPLAAVLLLLVCSVLASGTPQCEVPAGGSAASCTKPLGVALLQTHHASSKVEQAVAKVGRAAIQSGDSVLLRVGRTGHRVTAQQDGTVHAKWSHAGTWQRFVIEREAGSGDVESGDAVFLTAWTGMQVSVGDYEAGELVRTAVHAKWGHKGTWQKLTIEKQGGEGAISDGDEIFLQAWTEARLDADAPDSAGVVQARWNHQGGWQKLVIEAGEPATTAAPAPATPAPATTTTPVPTTPATTTTPAPSTPPPTTTTAPPQTTAAPVTTSTTQAETTQECTEKHSLGQCQPCLKTEQCGHGKYCCPYMKKCVASSRDPCYYPIAQCSPMCYDSRDNSQCDCANADFPDKWQLPTCGSGASTTPAPATTPSQAPASTSSQAATTPVLATMPPTTPAPSGSSETVSAKAWEHFELLNQLRAEGFTCPNGKSFEPNPVPLKFDCRLWRASRLHSEDMAAQSYFSHTSLDGRSPWERAEAQDTDAHGENIAAGSSTADGALGQFKNSDGHCKNMMSSGFKVAGMGYAAGGPYRNYWTQMFSLFDTDISELDTTCYPPDLALVQRHASFGGPSQDEEEGEHLLAEALSRAK